MHTEKTPINEELPLVSIMIATYNSSFVLERTLKAIQAQDYPQNKIEILIIDGGSSDNTLDLARAYKCLCLNNPEKDPVNAKLIGIHNANGKYLITIDHDEVLVNPCSVSMKVRAITDNSQCKVVFCSGYQRPNDYPLLNEYISEFGDPFSFFIYRFSKGYRYFESVLRKRFDITNETDEYILFDCSENKIPVIIELVCLGTMIDLEYFLEISDVKVNPATLTHLFYIMLENNKSSFIMIKNDPIAHYSVDSLKAYLPKLKWRIYNNIHIAERADAGFVGRTKYFKTTKYKKYLFIPYTFSLVFPMFDAVRMTITRKNISFLLHPFLCYYVSLQIGFNYLLSALRIKPKAFNYDGTKKL